MPVVSNETLSSIIGDIYDCALSPDGWHDVLLRITQTMDAAYTTIALAGTSDNQGRFAAQSPWEPTRMRELEAYSFDQIPGLKAAVTGDVDTPISTLSLMPESELRQTAFFRDWAGPQGLREGCITKFVHTSDRIGLLGVTTHLSRAAFDTDDKRFLALLCPHLRRAALIGDLLDNARLTTLRFRDTLKNLAIPIVLTDAQGEILYANAIAERMFTERGPIQRHDGKIQPENPALGDALLEAIASGSSDLSVGSKGIGLPISAKGKPPAVAYVLPLTQGVTRSTFRPACAAIFISTTTSASPMPEAVLTTLFDLTPAEARVLRTVGSGVTSSWTAETLGISENTLKTHLNRIYAKTGMSRQADLVKLMNEIGTPLSTD